MLFQKLHYFNREEPLTKMLWKVTFWQTNLPSQPLTPVTSPPCLVFLWPEGPAGRWPKMPFGWCQMFYSVADLQALLDLRGLALTYLVLLHQDAFDHEIPGKINCCSMITKFRSIGWKYFTFNSNSRNSNITVYWWYSLNRKMC